MLVLQLCTATSSFLLAALDIWTFCVNRFIQELFFLLLKEMFSRFIHMAMYLTSFLFIAKTPLYECTCLTFYLSMKLVHILIISILGLLRTMSYVLFLCGLMFSFLEIRASSSDRCAASPRQSQSVPSLQWCKEDLVVCLTDIPFAEGT